MVKITAKKYKVGDKVLCRTDIPDYASSGSITWTDEKTPEWSGVELTIRKVNKSGYYHVTPVTSKECEGITDEWIRCRANESWKQIMED